MKIRSLAILLLLPLSLSATLYRGQVVDADGKGVGYATVYPEQQPELGTATNDAGFFRFEANLTVGSPVIISFIGYEKLTVGSEQLTGDSAVLVLREQPIALEETVVAAKASKQRNKRKQLASLLHAVYVKLCEEFDTPNARYRVVSDVAMQSEGSTWGMEQMIANVVVLPEARKDGNDSVQWQGQYCKRFFPAEKRAQADTILAGQSLERLEKKSKEKYMRKAVNAVDSGVVVHRTLFSMGNMRHNFEQAMNDLRHWKVSNESEGETVLTHTETISKYLGFFKITFKRHYIVDSRTYAVRRFSEHADVVIMIPFGIKLNADQLQLLNLINMGEKQIEKFRLKKMRAAIDYNTIYQRRDGRLYIREKNLIADAHIIGSKKAEIPVVVKATQRVTDLQTSGVKPLTNKQITRRLERQIVEIY